jgi:2,4-dienoyl-CoA reductase-like NADH-dependent reductase (Old Yellow Enzyme family)
MLAKLNLSDAIAGGVTPVDAIRHAQMALDAGCDGVVLSCGLVDRTPFSLLRGEVPVSEMARYERAPLQKLALRAFAPMVIRRFPYEDLFLLPEARQVRAAVDGPLILLGGVTRGEHLDVAAAEGFTAVQVGRALIHDPNLARRWLEDPGAASGCTHCNRCVAEMEHEGARCVIR